MQVLGFPCNQFGAQEPGTNEEILEFVTSKFDVDFPMFSKIEVNGDGAAELYKILKAEQPGDQCSGRRGGERPPGADGGRGRRTGGDHAPTLFRNYV